MDTVITGPETDRIRHLFFNRIFGQHKGFIALFKLDSKKKPTEQYFSWPTQEPQLLAWVNENLHGNNLYFSCQLYSKPKRTKENVSLAPCVYSDIDAAPIEKLEPKPTIIVESSPGRYQGFWVMDEPMDPSDAEDYSRRFAYKYRNIGVDVSGWDLTQLLRIPQTYNYKYQSETNVPIVKIEHFEKLPTNSATTFFDIIDQVPGYEYLDTPFDPVNLPRESAEDLLDKYRVHLPPRVFELVQVVPEKDWSTALWSLEMLCLEAGLTQEETYVICNEAACNKYKRDGRPAKYLWRDIQRAVNTITSRIAPSRPKHLPLLSDTERSDLASYPESFADRYISWATGLGDAAVEYHEAGAFSILSGLLASTIRLPTSYGTILPNLWFMLLADTTLTRKTTAMDLAMELLMEINPDVVLATDGSLEGLMTSLAARPGRASIFWRDELTGLIELMAKRDYYAGMLEGFTKLYDGKYQKRILRKETIEIRDPCLIVFSGGVKTKMMSLLNDEHVSTGFLPRFIFFTAQADVALLKPVGPPTVVEDNRRKEILAEMSRIADNYTSTMTMQLGTQTIESKNTYFASCTPASWARYNELEAILLQEGIGSDFPEMMTPVLDRLAKSILKVAILLAASRQTPSNDGKFIIEVADLIKAISYGEKWRMSTLEVVQNLGKTGNEKTVEKVFKYISENTGTTRSRVMQHFHFTARDIEWVIETLDQRGLISRSKAGRTEKYFPVALESAARG